MEFTRMRDNLITHFNEMVKDAEYYLHLSGDGVTVKGHNTVTGDYDHIMIFYIIVFSPRKPLLL